MVQVSISISSHGVFPYVLILETAGHKAKVLHFMTKKDADFWIGYVLYDLRTKPIHEAGEMTGFEVTRSVDLWFTEATGVSMSEEDENDCEFGLTNPQSDLFFYFNTSAEKQRWIHNNLKKLAPVH